jgi:uncharacterized protein YggE
MPRTLLAAMILAMVAQSPAPAAAHDEAKLSTLTVGGDAEVAAAPDLAVVKLGATVQEPDAAAAQRGVNEIMSAAVAAIVATGVAKKDVQTAQLTLHLVYANRRPDPRSAEPDEGPRIVGYRATNTIQVQARDLSKVGAVLDAGMDAGANELQGIQFRLKDDEAQRLQALRAATEEAKRKAEAIAAAAGVSLAALHTIREGGQQVLQPQLHASRMAMSAESAGTPILPGQVTVRASVTLIYRLAD